VCAVTDIISHNGLSPVTVASDKQDDVSSLVTSACLARVRRYGYLLYHTTGLAPSAELWIRKETYHHVAPGLEVAPCAQ
jgi:hypothetical protein